MRLCICPVALCSLLAITAIAQSACPVVTRVRLLPRPGHEGAMAWGKIVASNDGPTTGFRELAVIKAPPARDAWVELAIENAEPHRWIKYEAPDNAWGNIAEIEFLAGGQKAAGAPFGTNGSRDNSGNTFEKALDGDPATFFEGAQADAQYVGLDFGPESQTPPPAFDPPGGTFENAISVKIASATPGAVIRYSASIAPTRQKGDEYGKPIRVDRTRVIAAIAAAPGLAASPVVYSAYRIGEKPDAGLVRTYHIGNSLTDTLNNGFEPISISLGRNHEFHRFTIPGAPTDWLWNHQDSGFGETPAHALQNLGVDHVSTQPFAGHGRSVRNEADHSQRFFEMARGKNPQVQPWLYAQWPGPKWPDRWAMGKWNKDDGVLADKGPAPVATWQEACRNHLIYTEAVADAINRQWQGKPVRIIPASLVLARVKDEVDAGRFDGMEDFLADAFADGIHLKPKAAYIVNLTVYTCIFDRTPEGEKDIAAKAGYTPEQALFLQKLTWKTVSDYRQPLPPR